MKAHSESERDAPPPETEEAEEARADLFDAICAHAEARRRLVAALPHAWSLTFTEVHRLADDLLYEARRVALAFRDAGPRDRETLADAMPFAPPAALAALGVETFDVEGTPIDAQDRDVSFPLNSDAVIAYADVIVDAARRIGFAR